MAEPEALTPSSEKLVFVVDDDDGVRELFEFVLKKEGFRYEMAEDGEKAIAMIEKSMPHIILLDLMLPRYGGFEVLRRLQTGPTSGIPIIIITGRYTDRSTSEMIRQESNVVDFMEKPVKAAVLGMALHKILKTKPPVSDLKPLGDW